MFSFGEISKPSNKKKALANQLEGIWLLDWKQVAKVGSKLPRCNHLATSYSHPLDQQFKFVATWIDHPTLLDATTLPIMGPFLHLTSLIAHNIWK
jgi:hypothetical protein